MSSLFLKLKTNKLFKSFLIGFKYISYVVTVFVLVVLTLAYFDKEHKDSPFNSKLVENNFSNNSETPNLSTTPLSDYSEIYINESGIFYKQNGYSGYTKVEGLHPKNVRFYDRYDSQRGTSYGPYIIANDTQLFLIDPSNGKFRDLSNTVKNHKEFKKLTYSEYENVGLYTDNIDFYFINYQGLYRLPINNGKIVAKSNYIKDDHDVFYFHQRIDGANASNFQIIESELRGKISDNEKIFQYAKDDNKVFYNGKKVINANPKTFQVFSRGYYQDYARDSKHVYYKGEIIEGSDPETFVILGHQPYEGCGYENLSKDKNNVYYATKKIIGADPKTIQILLNHYSKDSLKTFWRDIELNISPKDLIVDCYYG